MKTLRLLALVIGAGCSSADLGDPRPVDAGATDMTAGDSAIDIGLSFATSPPTELTDGQLQTMEGVATFSDASGALLMYSDGRTIWNRDHEPMPHATAADADQSLGGSSSATQSVVFVPRLGSSSQYYVFTQFAVEDVGASETGKGAEYSLVDLTLEGGLGDVVEGERRVALHSPSRSPTRSVPNRC